MSYLLQVAIAVVQIVLSFYGFWLIWRVLLPSLPGPGDPDRRIAPYAWYFIDPFVRPLAAGLRVSPRLVSATLLIVVAAAQVALQRLAEMV
jgi:hypothetical protein